MTKPAFCISMALILLSGISAAAEGPVGQGLAEPPLPEGWTCSGPVDVYTKDTLFKLINGEAELYFPYGFQRCFAVEYACDAEAEFVLSAEVYEMGSPLDAFGVYSKYRDSDEDFVQAGAEGFMGRTQIVFYQDRYFVKLRVAGKPREDRDALLTVARAMSTVLPENRVEPPEVRAIRVDGLVAKTETYVAESLLGYRFFGHGLMAETELDGAVARVFVVFHDAPGDAQKTIEEYTAYLKDSQAEYRWEEGPDGKVLTAQDPLHKGVLVQQEGTRVIGVARLADPDEGLPLLRQLQVEQVRQRALQCAESIRERLAQGACDDPVQLREVERQLEAMLERLQP